MELDAIAVYVKVVEAGSFSGAARLLKMPKTTVSAKVAALERRLGVTLIQRTTRKLHVTEAGQNYFRHCAAGLKEIELGEAELLAEQEAPKGLIRMTAPADIGHSILPQIVSEYLRLYPETQVELLVTNRRVDLVGEGVDLAFRAGELEDSSLRAKKFFDIRLGLWASLQYLKAHGHPKHPRDLEKHQIVAHSQFKTQNLELTDGKSRVAWTANPRIIIDDFETIKSLIIMEEGIGWLPKFLIAPTDEQTLAPVLVKWWFRSSGAIHFVYPGQRYASTKVRAFIDLASQRV